MKLGIFTDSHFSSAEITDGNRYNSKSLEKIKEAYKYFLEEKCDCVICLGDLTDSEKEHAEEIDNLKKISDIFKNYPFETYVLMGNHDAFSFDVDEFYSVLGEQYRPRNKYSNSKNLIFFDGCYFKNGEHYKPKNSDWTYTDTYDSEIDKLASTLKGITGDAYVFMHLNSDPTILEDYRVFNDSKIRKILENSNKVKTVFQGHYHAGKRSELNGIHYVTFPAMCENEKAYYIVEI